MHTPGEGTFLSALLVLQDRRILPREFHETDMAQTLLAPLPWRGGSLSHQDLTLLEGSLQRNREMVFANSLLPLHHLMFLNLASFPAAFGKWGSNIHFTSSMSRSLRLLSSCPIVSERLCPLSLLPLSQPLVVAHWMNPGCGGQAEVDPAGFKVSGNPRMTGGKPVAASCSSE